MSEKQNPFGEKSLLGGVISTEFPECSIVASDTNSLVRERIIKRGIIENGDGRSSFNSIEPREASRSVTYETRFVPDINERLASSVGEECTFGQDIRLAFASEVTASKKVNQGGWLRKRDVTLVATELSAPKLLVVFNNDIALPIAGFQQREGEDACDYVQLGNEMYDDNFFVTPEDEQSSRNDLVKSILEVAKSRSNFETLPAEHKLHLVNMVKSEISNSKHELVRALEHTAVRDLLSVIRKELDGRDDMSLPVLTQPTCELQDLVIQKNTRVQERYLSSGRMFTFVNICDKVTNTYALGVVTRGNLVMPIVELNDELGTFTFNGLEDASEEQRINMLKHMIMLSKNISIGNSTFFPDSINMANIKSFLDTFEVSKRLDHHLGETTPIEERLVDKAWQLSRSENGSRGVISGVKLSENNTSAIELEGKVTLNLGHLYRVMINARPHSQGDVSMRKYVDITFDSTGRIKNQLNGSSEHIEEIYTALDALV